MSHTPVLIVGAGPTGLMMACELARYGISFRIIDKKPERTLTSNAAGIQTRTLEILNHIGVGNTFIRNGLVCKSLNIYLDNLAPLKISFEHLDSLYRYILMLPQAETERIFISRLEEYHHHVERPLELTSIFKLAGDGYEATLKHPDGNIEKMTCDWIIGCDGAHSTLRDRCNMKFAGEDLQEQFMVADAVMDSFLPNNELHVFNSKGRALAVFPIGKNNYRLAANLHLEYQRQFFTEKEVKELVIDRGRKEFNVQSISWISPFWIHSKLVHQFRYDRIFLAGDAAHIHSPVGAQGMNTGIQDAYNLAWKLALVINKQAAPTLLDSYQAERYPIVKAIVKDTEKLTRFIISENVFFIWARNMIVRFLQNRKSFLNKIAMKMTQLSIDYQNSPIIDYHTINRQSPKPGMRTPDVQIQNGKHLFDYLQNPKHNILLFSGQNPSNHIMTDLQEIQKWITENYASLTCSFIVINDPAQISNTTIYDSDLLIHKKFNIQHPGIYIIRPDSYIGACNATIDKKIISQYFDKIKSG